MIYAPKALETKLAADTLTGVTIAGSTTTMLQLADAASWVGVEWVYAILGGLRYIARVTGVSPALDQISLDRALPSAPSAGTTIAGGFADWVYAVGAAPNDRYVYPASRDAVHPALAALNAPQEPRCIVIQEPIVSRHEAFTVGEERHWLRVLSKHEDWTTACAARAAKVLHGNRSGLTITGRRVYSIEVSDVLAPRRTGELIERDARVAIVTAEAA